MQKLRSSQRCLMVAITLCCLHLLNLTFCCSLNDEGRALLRFKQEVLSDPYGALSDWKDEDGVENPCSWFGVICFEGYVVNLELKNLCLWGTLTPDIANLVHVKQIVLRNNSFFGLLPKEILDLEELEIVDLRYNKFSGPFPSKLDDDKPTRIILLDTNEHELSYDESEEYNSFVWKSNCNSFLTWNSGYLEDGIGRKLLQNSAGRSISPPPPPFDKGMDPQTPPPPPPPPNFQIPAPDPSSRPEPPPSLSPPPTGNVPPPSSTPSTNRKQKDRNLVPIVLPAIAAFTFLLVIGYFLFRSCKMSTVKPWATGLSGKLQKTFVTGVPKLKRSELVAACEDFSNVITDSSSSVFKLYKGTLSSGSEIAVASFGLISIKDWSNSKEALFWKKIDTLSKVNHKNFICLLGYCVEKEPFTRMMVFEYAPNGTLFEHLHVREAEHLNWGMRLRIAMGIAYCLDHMHQLSPPLVHNDLTASSVLLTEDYAGKVADFTFEEMENDVKRTTESNVYSFGVVLFEMITGRLPYSVSRESVEYWTSDYLKQQPLREIIDPSLRTYHEGQLQLIGDVIRVCTNSNPMKRPPMKEVCARMREITGIGPDGAVPKLSPNWWAELEILSNEAS